MADTMTGTSAAKESADELEKFNAHLETQSLRGLWTRGEMYHSEPTPFGRPHLWKWQTIREGIQTAGRLVPTDFNGARRVITLVHPDLPSGSSPMLGMAVQLVKKGESVYAHRHTAAAIRFVLEGSEDVYTITNGEKCVMEAGDLLVQPSWGWHNHVNESDSDAIWIDCLDVGLMAMFRTMFQEPHPTQTVQLFNSPVDSAVRNPGSVAPPGRQAAKLSYKWTEARAALENMVPEDKTPLDGRCLEYLNTVTGGPTLPTFSCWIQMLEPGEQTVPHRHTSHHVCHAFGGRGVTEAGDTTLEWEKGDFFVIPNWTWHSYRNTSDTEPAFIFSTTDRPLLEGIGLYREEAREAGPAK